MEQKELNVILEKHLKWLNNSEDGEQADLSNTDLRYADLSNTDLSEADLNNANLNNANLRGANLSYAGLSYTNLRYADLSNTDLRYADLSEADLREADLNNANLRGADLNNANLKGYNWIKGSSFDLQFYNGFLQIGCEKHSLEYWLIMYEVIGKENDFTEGQIKEYKNYMDTLKNIK